MKKRTPARRLTLGAVIAALYVALTFLAAQLGLHNGVIQLRLSEALCALPIFFPAAIPGLTVGCLLANLLTGSVILDVAFGPVATLLGAVGTYLLRRHPKLALLPPILSNMLIVPWVLRFGYGLPDAIWWMCLTVGLGELLSAGVMGYLLYLALKKRSQQFQNVI